MAKEKALRAAGYIASTPQYQIYVAPTVSKVAAQPRVAAVLDRLRPLVAAF